MRSISKTKSNWINWLIWNTTHLINHGFLLKLILRIIILSLAISYPFTQHLAIVQIQIWRHSGQLCNCWSFIGHRIFLIMYKCWLVIYALIELIELIVEVVHLNSNSRLCWRVHFLAVVENGGVVVSYRIGLLSGVELFEGLGISVLTWLGLDTVREWTVLVRITYRLIIGTL